MQSADELLHYISEGNTVRIFAATHANKNSSRSHTIVRILIEQEEVNTQTGRGITKTSQINLVDLAGSEGASKTKSYGMRLHEGGMINKSLLALSRVVQKLSMR